MFLLYQAFLTVALALAAKVENPSDYSGPQNVFRLCCEIVVFLGTLIDIALEVLDLAEN